jgi:hypothetical protein
MCFVIAGLMIAATSAAWGLEAGTGIADITPDVKAFKVPLAGYGARRNRPSTGVHDPLHAKVLFLRNGDVRMALITCDLRSITPELKNQVIEKSAGLGITTDNLFMAASHTHDGPAMYREKFWQLQFGAYDPKIVDIMSTSVAKALKEAVQNAVPVKVGFGEGKAEGFMNNRRWKDDLAAREAAGEKPALEPVVWVMRVDGMDGKPRAILVNFGVHPTILGADNMLISAEWPGVLQTELEKAFPGSVALFTNGAEGDQAPQSAKGLKDAFERVTEFGVRLSKVVTPIVQGIETKADVPIAFKYATPDLPKIAIPAGMAKRFAAAGAADIPEKGLPHKAELQILRIGSTALVGLPGEPILEVGQAVRKGVVEQGFSRAVAVGLANDYIGYLVSAKEFPHGGYEVDLRSYYGPGLEAFLVEQTKKIAGDLK